MPTSSLFCSATSLSEAVEPNPFLLSYGETVQSLGKLCCVEAKEPSSNSSCQFLQLRSVDPLFFFNFCKEILSLLPCCPHLLQLSCCDRNGSSKLLRSPRCVKKIESLDHLYGQFMPCLGGKFLGQSFQATILGPIIFSHNHL